MVYFSSLIALAAALFSTAAFGADVEVLLRAKWVQAESPHFRVVTDQRAETARLLVDDLEHMRHFSLRALGIDALPMSTPLTVLAIGNAELFKNVGLSENYAGLFVTSLHGYAAIASVNGYVGDSDTPTIARSVLLHEYHHFLIRMTQLTMAYPIWCNEGMSEYFSSLRYDNTSVSVGDIEQYSGRISGLYSPSGRIQIDSAKLFNTTKLDFADATLDNKAALDAFYSRAGFVIHYFNSSPELRAQLALYLRLYNLGIGQDRAAQLAFKRSYAELDKDVSQYLRRHLNARVFKATDGPFKFPPVEIKVEALDQRRFAAALASVLIHMGVPDEVRQAVLTRNLQLNPNSAQAHIDRLRFASQGDSIAEVEALNERFPGNAQLLSIQGDIVLGYAEALRASGLPGWQTLLPKARALFRRAVNADPGYPAAYASLGRLYLSLPDSEPLDEGIAGFDTASIYLPSPAMFRGVATLALRARRQGVALAALRHAVTFAAPDAYSEDALLLDNLELLNELEHATPTATADGLVYASGTRYMGQVHDLKPDGAGKLERINGSYLEGTFRDGLPLTGKLLSVRGGQYEGQFSAGVAAGQGTLRYPDGAPATSYVGAIALGKPDGYGVLTGPTGRYEGDFLNGEAHGEGSFTPAAKPLAMHGKWLYGRYVWPASDGEVFVGFIDANGEASGAGYCFGAAANNHLHLCRHGDDHGKLATSTD